MAAEAPPRTHCPTCGAKLHRLDLSLCAYCATPLALGGKAEVAADEIALRLARLRDHAEFARSMDWTPRDPETEMRGERMRRRAGLFALLAAVLFGASEVFWLRRSDVRGLQFAAAVAAALGLAFLFRMSFDRRRSLAQPLRRRPALVVSRRSVTAEKGGLGATVYFFTLHFDDASEGEFRWPGQGVLYEPMPNGTTGVAYTRGERLIEFRKL